MRKAVIVNDRPGPVRVSRRDAIAEALVLLSWVVVAIGGFVVTVVALVVQVRGVEQPASALGGCRHPESVVILEEDSLGVVELDPTDRRSGAVREVIGRLAAEPCTDLDVVTVISFTGTVATTGPAPASQIGSIGRADGGGTDVAAAVDAALGVIASLPDHRPVVVLLADVDDRSTVTHDEALRRLTSDGIEARVVPIGDRGSGSGVVGPELRSGESIVADLIRVIVDARQRE